MFRETVIGAIILGSAYTALGGPYTEAGVNGYVDPNDHWRHADPCNAGAVINPIFRGWATDVYEYCPADEEWLPEGFWHDPSEALGPATGENFDIVSLGELDAAEIAAGAQPGRLTLSFGQAGDGNAIRDGKGYDFAIFENGFVSLFNTFGGSVAGEMLGELGYVEVSSNGSDFARFPSVSLTAGPVGMYGTIEISDIHNLAGKHPNSGGLCTGTPFDLSDIAGDPLVVGGAVDINDIRYVRIVDVPGDGSFPDRATSFLDLTLWPSISIYEDDHPIYDAWVTYGSGGIDVEAVGVLCEQEYEADIDLNGIVDGYDFALFAQSWGRGLGHEKWIGRCDLAEPKDYGVDKRDLALFAGQWLGVEKWRTEQ